MSFHHTAELFIFSHLIFVPFVVVVVDDSLSYCSETYNFFVCSQRIIVLLYLTVHRSSGNNMEIGMDRSYVGTNVIILHELWKCSME